MKDWIICIKKRGGRVRGGQGVPIWAYPPGRWHTLISRGFCCGRFRFLVFDTDSLTEKDNIRDSNKFRMYRSWASLERTADG